MSSETRIVPADADAIYEQLIASHAGRSGAESLQLNARLILLLIDQVGDAEKVRNLICKAQETTFLRESEK